MPQQAPMPQQGQQSMQGPQDMQLSKLQFAANFWLNKGNMPKYKEAMSAIDAHEGQQPLTEIDFVLDRNNPQQKQMMQRALQHLPQSSRDLLNSAKDGDEIKAIMQGSKVNLSLSNKRLNIGETAFTVPVTPQLKAQMIPKAASPEIAQAIVSLEEGDRAEIDMNAQGVVTKVKTSKGAAQNLDQSIMKGELEKVKTEHPEWSEAQQGEEAALKSMTKKKQSTDDVPMLPDADPNRSGMDILKNYPPKISNKASMLLQREVAPGGFSLRDPDWKAALDVAHEAEAGFSMQDYSIQMKNKEAYMGRGKYGIQDTALNTAVGHLAEYKSTVGQLNKVKESGIFNSLAAKGQEIYENQLKKTPEWRAADAAKRVVEADVSSVLKAGIGNASPSAEDVQHWKDEVSLDLPQDTINKGINEMGKVIGTRIQQIYEGYNRDVGRFAKVPEFISGTGEKAFASIGITADDYIPEQIKQRTGTTPYGAGSTGKFNNQGGAIPKEAEGIPEGYKKKIGGKTYAKYNGQVTEVP
jgi:hypothetical protein